MLVAKHESQPNEKAEDDRRCELSQWIADANMCCDGSAEVTREQDCPENGSARDEVHNGTCQLENAEIEEQLLLPLEMVASLHDLRRLHDIDDGLRDQHRQRYNG